MSKVSEYSVVDKVEEVTLRLGYDATLDLATPPFRIFGWFRKRKFRPDIIVKHDNRAIVVATKSRPVMLYDVFLIDQARKGKDMGAPICVPDDSFAGILESSKDYADERNVRLCPVSEVGDALRSLLN